MGPALILRMLVTSLGLSFRPQMASSYVILSYARNINPITPVTAGITIYKWYCGQGLVLPVRPRPIQRSPWRSHFKVFKVFFLRHFIWLFGYLHVLLTSYGPSNDFFFKPAVAAPGGNIVSTIPVNLGNFSLASGTSMACPFAAGSAALLLAAKGRTTDVAKGARDLFETTARWVPSDVSSDLLQTAAQQGAGLINVFDAIHATTIVSPGELILNDTAHFKSQ